MPCTYALYLWHWPLLVIYLITAGRESAGLADGAVIIAASLVLAVVTTRVVEKPLRAWTWPERRRHHLGLVLAAGMALVAVPLSGWEMRVNAEERAAEEQSPADNPGAAALEPGFVFGGSPDALVKPFTSGLDGEWAQTDGDCRPEYAPASSAVDSCLEIGDPATARKTVMVLGDSHAQQWLAALGPVARSNDWYVVALLKPACRYGDVVDSRPADCNAHNEAVRDYVLEKRPDAVFTVATVTAKGSPEEVLADGYLAGVRDFAKAGIRVAGIRDNPRFTFNMAECVDRNGAGSPICDRPRSELLPAASPLEGIPVAARRMGIRVGVMDLTDYLCGPDVCSGVIGNVLAYIDHDHLGRTYVETMAPVFEKRFKAALGWS